MKTDLFVNLGNIEEIAAKALRLLKDKRLHEKFSKQAVLAVHKRFRAELIVGQYENVYYQLVGDERK